LGDGDGTAAGGGEGAAGDGDGDGDGDAAAALGLAAGDCCATGWAPQAVSTVARAARTPSLIGRRG